ncbi:MAG: orotate phosphoribosyltransferase, partial [Dehalococcoidales bacterium]|nr:orotate phosphoribosyltransferase [Dehalococcoidales bacterium]
MNNAEEIFQKSGAVLQGHFLLTSGLHSPAYWEKFRVIESPAYTSQLCQMIAEHFRNENIQV